MEHPATRAHGSLEGLPQELQQRLMSALGKDKKVLRLASSAMRSAVDQSVTCVYRGPAADAKREGKR